MNLAALFISFLLLSATLAVGYFLSRSLIQSLGLTGKNFNWTKFSWGEIQKRKLLESLSRIYAGLHVMDESTDIQQEANIIRTLIDNLGNISFLKSRIIVESISPLNRIHMAYLDAAVVLLEKIDAHFVELPRMEQLLSERHVLFERLLDIFQTEKKLSARKKAENTNWAHKEVASQKSEIQHKIRENTAELEKVLHAFIQSISNAIHQDWGKNNSSNTLH